MTLLELRPDGVVHELHALRLPAHDGVLQLLCGAFADDGGHGAVDHEDFVDGDASATVLTFEQKLCNHAAQRGGEHGANLRLLVGRKDIDHAVDSLARVVGVQGSENEQARLRGGQGERDCLQIAHLPDQHDVRVFAQSRLQTCREIDRVLRHLALGDDAVFVRVNELDRLFNRHDMPGEVRVDVVHQRGQRRALAAAGRARHEDQAAPQMSEFLDHRRQTEFVEGGNARRNQPEHRTESVHLLEIIATKAVVRVHLVGEVEIPFFMETLPIFRRADFAQHVVHFIRGQQFLADGNDVAMATDFRGLPLGKVQVGCSRVDQNLEKLVDVRHGFRLSRRVVSSAAFARHERQPRLP